MTEEKRKEQEPKQEVKLEDLPVDDSKQGEIKGGGWLATPAGS